LDWTLVTYRLAAEPSRHRVAVWRELRKLGALSLQQATWAVPRRRDLLEGVDRVVALVEAGGGAAIVFDSTPRDERSAARLEALFTEEREAEWLEFLADCDKYEKELKKEIQIKKFTPAELIEEEQSLDRLRRWFYELRARDVFKAGSFDKAELRLKECTEKMEEFAERVFKEVEIR
jgi:hypothetical protein